MEKTNKFALRFRDSEQKQKAEKKAKDGNRSLNGYISELIDRDLKGSTVHYGDIKLSLEGLRKSRKGRV